MTATPAASYLHFSVLEDPPPQLHLITDTAWMLATWREVGEHGQPSLEGVWYELSVQLKDTRGQNGPKIQSLILCL